jgi:hypothetical protein
MQRIAGACGIKNSGWFLGHGLSKKNVDPLFPWTEAARSFSMVSSEGQIIKYENGLTALNGKESDLYR